MRLFGVHLREAGDPDWAVFGDTFAIGVPVGWGRKLPRTPAVFDRKTKWSLDVKEVLLEDFSDSEDAVSAGGAFRANYKSAKMYEDTVAAMLLEQSALSPPQVIVLSEAEARRRAQKLGRPLLVARCRHGRAGEVT